MRFDPARAGIMTKIFLGELIIYKAIIFFRKNIIRYLHEIIALKG
jgi:hypothetical protein